MNNYNPDDYVWCQNGNMTGLIGRVYIPENIKKSKRANTALLLFMHDKTFHNIGLKNLWSFKERFTDFAENYIRKYDGLEVLEKAISDMKWAEGKIKLNELISLPKDLPQKRLRPNNPCEVCQKVSGPQIFCISCKESSIHKKKCARITSNIWTCKKCKDFGDTPMLGYKDSVNSLDILNLSRSQSNTIGDINIQETIQAILQESIKDPTVYKILTQRQKDYEDIEKEVTVKNEALSLVQKPEELRREKYKIQEFSNTRKDNLFNELIDQLHCAHISGFESIKKLKKYFQNDEPAFEKYRNAQKEVVSVLLKTQLPNNDKITPEDPVAAKFSKFLDKSNPKGLFARLNSTIDKFNDMKVDDLIVKPSTTVLYGIVKVIIDGTLANCEYTPGQHIDHVGGGTNPEDLKALLKKVKEKYMI
ncbi:hypothetical protein SteCoe_17343 [Stentor coeruleus]|uniref:Uncharacterized protein n=1 Tax=Stentor coeruleus TaxID=5963 RepID=A0A1R2BZ73_9CILI|nr:hypothetical protein SteCoe_17343 [Stentor coeruleus]